MNGVLLVDKPAGPTSFDVVARVRRALGGRRSKVGHTGTLDPFATGLLVVMCGAATRLAPYLSGVDKRYRATLRLGVRSDTGDRDGVLEPSGQALPDRAALAGACARLVGELSQRPPLASAVKVDGRRAYELHREGSQLELPSRPVTVHAFDVVSHDEAAGRAVVEIACSKGTYVRSLARDVGDDLGCGAYCEELCRTAVGAFELSDAGSLDEVCEDPDGPWSRSCAEAVAHLPWRNVDAAEAAELRHGRSLPADGEGVVACLCDGDLVAIAEAADGRLQPRVVLPVEAVR